jgi:capsular polysaccharide export protein
VGRRRLLVAGQVEGDASIRFGSPQVHSNLELLQRVREAEPAAWIVYKPHPDTEAGTRSGRVEDGLLRRYADEVVHGVSPTALFGQVDAVHTMTSLLGFEALLRGILVVTWGQPFYAGWGLTDDRLPVSRRTRRLDLDRLVAAVLLQYPLYADLQRRRLCTAEEVAHALALSGPASSSRQQSAAWRYVQLMQGLHRSWSTVYARY